MKKAEVQAIDNDRQQGGQQKKKRQCDERVVGDTAEKAIFRVAPALNLMAAHGNGFAKALAEQNQPQAADHLN